jgi:hypothetical protein
MYRTERNTSQTKLPYATSPTLLLLACCLLLWPQGLGSLQTIGQDLVIKDNPELTSLADLPRSLTSVGQQRGGDLIISNNPKLNTLDGLGSSGTLKAVRGKVNITGNGSQLSNDGGVAALQKLSDPIPFTPEAMRGSMAAPAAAGAAPPAAANATAAGAANATAAPVRLPGSQPAAAAPVPAVSG